MQRSNGLLTQKELAAAVQKGLRTIQRDVANGFEMPGGLATIEEWRDFKRAELRRNREASEKKAA